MLTEGKIYVVLSTIYALPIDLFKINNDQINHRDFDKVITIENKSNPNIFMFIEYLYDMYDTQYCKILYNNNLYVIQGPYHIEDFITKI